MKNIRKFETIVDYEAWMSDNVVYPNVCYVAEDGRIAYNPPPPIPLYIEASDDFTVTFSNTYEYSKNNFTWTSATSSTEISASAGERVYFRASGLEVSTGGMGSFSVKGSNYNVGGNIMSMIYGADFDGKTEITQEYQFREMFKKTNKYASYLIDASALVLPTKLSQCCYWDMFKGQRRLIVPPMLLATTLEPYCYTGMFTDCYALVNAPALPATTLARCCYYEMFINCTSLVNAPELPATTLAESCYESMFQNCTSLVNAPTLPATTLASKCYYQMFYKCSKLNYIKAMFTTIPDTVPLANWVSGVSATGTFVKNSAATWEKTGSSGIPSGWTVETADA